MKSKTYLALVITIYSVFIFALITITGTSSSFSILENALAQEDAVDTQDTVNDTQIDKDRGVNDTQIDKDGSTSRSSTDFSAINDTMLK
jgi:hypothetical protein